MRQQTVMLWQISSLTPHPPPPNIVSFRVIHHIFRILEILNELNVIHALFNNCVVFHFHNAVQKSKINTLYIIIQGMWGVLKSS
jgi:hypothetical protein